MSKDNENEKTIWTNHYLCPTCGEEWQDQHEATCNDRCTNCRKEIEPFISNDGSLTEDLIDKARDTTLAKHGLCRCDDCQKIWSESDLQPVIHPARRIDVGGPIPDGECPACGALAYKVGMPETLYVVVHRHEYGSTPYLVVSRHLPACDELVDKLKIDFEPDKGEELDVMDLAGQLRPIRLEETA